MAAILKSELVDKLQNQVANNAYTLYESLAVCVADQPKPDELHAAVNDCNDYLHALQQACEQANLSGLQQICEIAEVNINALPEVAREERQVLCSELEELPRKICNYLYDPSDRHKQAILIASLQNTKLPHALSSQVAAELADLLATDVGSDNLDKKSDKNEYSFDDLSDEDIDELHFSADDFADDLASDIVFEELDEADLSQLTTSQGNSFDDLAESSIELPSEELDKMLDEQMFEDDEHADYAVSDELAELGELGELSELDELDELGELEELETEQAVEVDQDLIDKFLQTESAQAIVETEEPVPEPVVLSPSSAKTLTALSNKVLAKTDDLERSLNQFITTDYDDEQFLPALEEYTNIIQELWENAGAVRLQGLQTVFTFINENLFELSNHQSDQRFAKRELFAHCPQLILDYLHSPDEGGQTLLAHLQQSDWLIPLTAENASHLSIQLIQEVFVSQLEEPRYKPLDSIAPPKIEFTHSEEQEEQEEQQNAHEFHEVELAHPDWGDAYIDEDVLLASELEAESELTENAGQDLLGEDKLEELEDVADLEYLEEVEEVEEVEQIEEIESLEITELSAPEQNLFAVDIDENLESFNAELAEALLDLDRSLDLLALADSDSEELLDAVERCSDNIQAIADAADKAELVAVQNISMFLNDNIFALSTREASIRRAAKPLIENTVNLIKDYIYTPDATAPILIEHLTNPSWLQPLENPQLLLMDLQTNADAPEIQAICEANLAATPTPTTVVEPKLQLADYDVLQLVIAQINDSKDILATNINILVSAEDGSEDLLNAVESITSQVQTIWDTAEMAGLLGLQDVCTFVNDNIMAFGIQEQDTRYAARDLLSDWSQLVLNYLYEPEIATQAGEASNTEQLVEHLCHFAWISPLDEEQAQVLKQRLLTPVIQVNQELNQPIINPLVLADEDVLNIIREQINDSIPAMQQIISDIVAAKDGDPNLLSIVEQYVEQVQVIWDTAEMANLKSIQQICSFVNDNIMALGMLEQNTRKNVHSVFNDWLPMLLQYLEQPEANTPKLIEFFKSTRWLMPMHSDDAHNLHDLLLTSCETSETSETSSLEPVPTETIKSPVAPIILAAPETIELLIAQITETAVDLNAILSKLTAAEDGSEDLLLAVDAYTENVQIIWDTAEMANLPGLQQVCSFINDNIMALGASERASRQAAQSVFSAWTDYVILYLQEPGTGVQELVSHLQNPHWLNAIEKPAELLNLLLPGSKPVDIAPITKPAPNSSGVNEKIRAIMEGSIVEGLSAALEVCVSMENDSPKLLEAVEDYTNQVQILWEAADKAGLIGLRELCTHINDNITNFVMLDQTTKLEKNSYFASWPELVLDYLTDPEAGALQLVLFLQDEAWPIPLEEQQAQTLLAQLTQGSVGQISEPEIATSVEDVREYIEDAQEIEDAEDASESMEEMETDGSEISLGNAEVLEILKAEVEAAKEELAEKLQQFTSLDSDDPLFVEVAENYAEQVQRLNTAAEMLGLEGLQSVTDLVVNNVNAWAKTDLPTRQKAKKPLSEWPDLVLNYLNSPMDSVIAMLNHFREGFWIQPLPDNKAHELLNQLTKGSTADEDSEMRADESDNRQKIATPEDVALDLPEDVNAELLDAYLQETPQHATDFSECIQNIIRQPDKAELERAKRIAHTLKGSSNIIGIKGIANMGHHLEDILEYLTEHQVVPPKELTDLMVEVADCIESMVASLSGDEPPDNSQMLLQQVLDWANQIDKGELKAPPMPTKLAAPAPKADTAKVAVKKDAAAPEQMLRVPTKTVDDLMRLVGELSISMVQIQERLKHVIGSTRVLTEQDLLLQKKTFELENLVDVRGVSRIGINSSKDLEKEEDFDPLEFEEYNELHSVAHSFIESIADSRELAMSIRSDLSELESMFIHQERLNKEFEATIMTTRMVPVSTIVAKLQRNVRQTCRTVNKEADLQIIGDDLLIDSDVLSNLGDPLMHILRNAIDHGLETPEERAALGKAAQGTVTVHFYREGNNIVVACKDDGKGLNYDKIREKAKQRGLMTEHQDLSENELARLILMSGFSTKDGVTQVSGRGVGMDVVHTNIRNMKGTLDIFSTTGEGSHFIIKLPLTLVTVHVLIVRLGNLYYGVPTTTIAQALVHSSGEFKTIGHEKHLEIGKNIYPLKALSDLIQVEADYSGLDNCENRPVVLVRGETSIVAVLVDELVDTHDLVMKSMGNYVKKVRGVSGASILGDGSLVPLLDIPGLLSNNTYAMAMDSFSEDDEGIDSVARGMVGATKVMVVDDSLSVRKSMSLLLEESGFEVILAKDGLEAIEVMAQNKPKVMLVDMEMPRMNGLELTAHVRANQDTGNIPIFMITSRTTEKHREQAKNAGVDRYLTKPYQDTELLDLIDQALAGKIR